MKTLLAGKCSELVFNLDEVGSSDWKERKPKKIIIVVLMGDARY
jgi:hypothetical protein